MVPLETGAGERGLYRGAPGPAAQPPNAGPDIPVGEERVPGAGEDFFFRAKTNFTAGLCSDRRGELSESTAPALRVKVPPGGRKGAPSGGKETGSRALRGWGTTRSRICSIIRENK